MNSKHNIVVFGAGGIGEAVGLMLIEYSDVTPDIYIGDIDYEKAKEVCSNLKKWTTKSCNTFPFNVPFENINEDMIDVLTKCEVILDCLPGTQAPRIAKLALQFNCHYANLTEYVEETNEIIKIANNSDKGFILQTGLAPGFINILANSLFQNFCSKYSVEKVNHISMKVGALPQFASSPHNYGFTWSPIGVATEYLKDVIALRGYKKVNLNSLTERGTITIKGVTYEEDLTSGGAADLPDALEGLTDSLDYKTLRHVGHYDWVKSQIRLLQDTHNKVGALQNIMEENIPVVEDDSVIIYASVTGNDHKGTLRKIEKSYEIMPVKVGNKTLRAIQATTAAPLAECAKMLLEGQKSGVITQSMISVEKFLNGEFIKPIYN